MTVDLAPFCGDAHRHLAAPFSRSGHTYASNGAIAVRVPQRPDVPENKKAPKAEALPWDFSGVEFGPLPELEPLPDTECKRCSGRGYQHDCPNCDCECEGCDGSGKPGPRFQIGEAVFAGMFIDRMRALPGLEIGKPNPKYPHDPLPFRFKGGEGLLMPMRDRG